jgi:MFS family permease
MAKKTHPLSPAQVQRGMSASIWDAVLAGPFYNLIQTSGVFFTGLALAVGADNFQIGLYAAVVPLLSGLSFVSARLMERGGSRKRHYISAAAVQRGLFFSLLIFPFLAARLAPASLAWLLLALLTVSTVFHQFQLTAWMSWMADMIPESRRGSFFARRNVIGTCSWMALSYGLGLYLDAHKSLGDYTWVFCGTAFFSLVALHFAAKQPDPPLRVTAKQPSLSALWKTAYADKNIRKFIFFQLAWGFTSSLAAPFYNVYMLKNLQLDMSRVALWTVLATALALVSAPWWGHVLDRAGDRLTLLFALLGACLLGGLWPFVTPSNLGWLLAFIMIAGGFFQAGVGQATFNMFLGVLPDKNKTSFVAFIMTIVGVIVGFSPILGGWLAKSVDSVMTVIVVSAVLRLLPLTLVFSIQNRKGQGIVTLVQEYVLVNPFKVMAVISSELFGGERGKK